MESQPEIKKCPNCDAFLKKIIAKSHYSWTVELDQCPECGGIWCDDLEMWSVSEDTVKEIDLKKIGTLHQIRKELFCPICNVKLNEFKDPCFPNQLKLSFCPKCSGFWLNRGELTEFKKLQNNKKTNNKKNEEFGKQIEALLNLKKDKEIELLGNLARFVNGPKEKIDDPELAGVFISATPAGVFLNSVYYLVRKMVEMDREASEDAVAVDKKEIVINQVKRNYAKERKRKAAIATIILFLAITIYQGYKEFMVGRCDDRYDGYVAVRFKPGTSSISATDLIYGNDLGFVPLIFSSVDELRNMKESILSLPEMENKTYWIYVGEGKESSWSRKLSKSPIVESVEKSCLPKI